MSHRKATGTTAPVMMLSLAAALFGCADTSEYDATSDYQAAVLVNEWTFCAKQNARCAFEGTHDVRMGRNGKFTTRTFTNGVVCNNKSFGTRWGYGATCEVLLPVETPEEDHSMHTDAGSVVDHSAHDAGAVDSGAVVDHSNMPGMVDAGTMPDMGSMHGSTGTDGGAAMANMPYVNRAAIPKGNPGVSGVEIGTTDEPPRPDSIGSFRTTCSYSHMNFDDPIVAPGKKDATHLHTFFGNTGTNANSTAESIQNSGNSTCRGGIANRTAYWVPALLDAQGNPIAPAAGQFYYKTGYAGIKPQDVVPFPRGLRMIAGDAKSQTGQEKAYWGCADYYVGHLASIPDCSQGGQVTMSVEFPQCWNGKDLDSADHKSHMAYPRNDACPSTHPVAIPAISMNIYYNASPGSTKGWHLSSDMYDPSLPGGMSAHGDWFDGWDPEIVKTFVKNCDNKSVDCHSHLLGDGRMIFNSREYN